MPFILCTTGIIDYDPAHKMHFASLFLAFAVVPPIQSFTLAENGCSMERKSNEKRNDQPRGIQASFPCRGHDTFAQHNKATLSLERNRKRDFFAGIKALIKAARGFESRSPNI